MDELNIDAMVDAAAASSSNVETLSESPVDTASEASPAAGGSPEASTSAEAKDSALTGEGVETPSPAPAPAAAVPMAEVPRTWRPEAAAEWGKLSPTVQAEILKREEDIFRGLEGYKSKVAQAQPLMEAVAPYSQILAQHNLAPAQVVQNLLQAQYQLAFGSPQQKAAMLQQIASDYGVEWGADADMMAAPDPQVQQLSQRLAQVEQARYQEIRQQTSHEVDMFAAEVGQSGQLAHPYFDEVANEISGLIKSGQATDLKTAYEKAVWLNPVTREKEVQRLQTTAQAEAAAMAEKARKAEAANVKTVAKAATAGSATGTIDDTLNAALKEIRSRAA